MAKTGPRVSLNFDTYQRMAVVARACGRLGELGCRTAVDVGGYPGVLADSLPAALRCRAVIDLPACSRPDYVRGSALQLPLLDSCVDVALCADTMEHVKEPVRAADELARIARRAVVISAPWRNDATDAVETMLNRWHLQITGLPHPWLVEHREFGLPACGEVRDAFQARGWHTEEFACGTLAEWALLQLAMILQDVIPLRRLPFAAFNEEYNAHWPAELTTSLPSQPYRTVLVASPEKALIDSLLVGADTTARPHDRTTARIESTLPLIDSLLSSLQEALASRDTAERFEEEFRERLEALTAQQAAEIEALRARVNELEAQRGPGLLRRAKRAVNRISKREPA